jgi:hypothetical protein
MESGEGELESAGGEGRREVEAREGKEKIMVGGKNLRFRLSTGKQKQ